MTPQEADEELQELHRQLRCWMTEMWMRHAEAPVDDLYAASCVFCRGTGRAHFCLSECDAPPNHECLHPTAEEKQKLNKIRDELMILRNRIQLEIEKEQLPMRVLFKPPTRSERTN